MNDNAYEDVEMESYIYSDPVSEDMIQQDNLHTAALTLAERVHMDTLGMDAYLIDQVDTQTRYSLSKLDLMDITANDLDWNQYHGLHNISDEHIGLRVESATGYPGMQDVVQQRLLPPNTANHSFRPVASTSFSNKYSSAHQFESQPWPPYDFPDHTVIGLVDQIAQDKFGITSAQSLSGPPWAPLPILQLDAQYCFSDDTLSSRELSSDRRLSLTSLPVEPSNTYLYASSVQPTCSSRLVQPVTMYREQDIAPDLAQSFAPAHRLPTHPHNYNVGAPNLVGEEITPLKSQMHLRERLADTTRRWSCSSHLSAPGNMENAAPSPTPSEVSVTPSGYSDVLLCLVEGCETQFTGLYRKGNQRRHFRLIHNSVQYPCGVPGCYKTFNRQDARLKHHRKHHTYELPSLKPPSKRTSRKST
jgi:hypothetical protein